MDDRINNKIRKNRYYHRLESISKVAPSPTLDFLIKLLSPKEKKKFAQLIKDFHGK